MLRLQSPRRLLLPLLLALVVLDAASGEDAAAAAAAAAAALPLVMHTWPWTGAAAAAWAELSKEGVEATGSRLTALELAGNYCELSQACGSPPSVGYGGHPDAKGEVTLDALMFDGPTHDVGAVGGLRRIKAAISVARGVLVHTNHTLLVGDAATAFARDFLGMSEEPLDTPDSNAAHAAWEAGGCQPNYYRGFEGSDTHCPPYPLPSSSSLELAAPALRRHRRRHEPRYAAHVDEGNHDTIGIIVIDRAGDISCGTSTNGLANKVPGRTGDSPIPGAGCYVDNRVGAAAATGDGDVMMRFSPTFAAVSLMGHGLSPQEACEKALRPIAEYYPHFTGGLICANKEGQYGAAGINWVLSYSVQTPQTDGVETHDVPPIEIRPFAPDEAAATTSSV
jgi:N4-(beta-N-acetylglucosaminyl)-L-asparaginase